MRPGERRLYPVCTHGQLINRARVQIVRALAGWACGQGSRLQSDCQWSGLVWTSQVKPGITLRPGERRLYPVCTHGQLINRAGPALEPLRLAARVHLAGGRAPSTHWSASAVGGKSRPMPSRLIAVDGSCRTGEAPAHRFHCRSCGWTLAVLYARCCAEARAWTARWRPAQERTPTAARPTARIYTDSLILALAALTTQLLQAGLAGCPRRSCRGPHCP